MLAKPPVLPIRATEPAALDESGPSVSDAARLAGLRAALAKGASSPLATDFSIAKLQMRLDEKARGRG